MILRVFLVLEVKPISLYEHLFNTDSTLYPTDVSFFGSKDTN